MGEGVPLYRGLAYLRPKYLQVINQAKKLLNKICSTLLPGQIHLEGWVCVYKSQTRGSMLEEAAWGRAGPGQQVPTRPAFPFSPRFCPFRWGVGEALCVQAGPFLPACVNPVHTPPTHTHTNSHFLATSRA